MTLTLLETIQRVVREELGRARTAELAIVEEQHPHAEESDTDNYACTVALRDSDVVLKQVPVATPRIGTASIPAIGELVLVQFMGGDVNAPVITGRLYNDQDRPPPNGDGQAIAHLPLGAEDEQAVHAELHSGEKRELVVRLGKGLALALRDANPPVELDVQEGKAKLKVTEAGGLTLVLGEGKAKLETAATGDTTLDVGEGKARLAIEGSGATALDVGEGKAKLEIGGDGATKLDVGSGRGALRIDADGAVTVRSQGTLNLEGAQVTVKAQGPLALKGATVNIN